MAQFCNKITQTGWPTVFVVVVALLKILASPSLAKVNLILLLGMIMPGIRILMIIITMIIVIMIKIAPTTRMMAYSY